MVSLCWIFHLFFRILRASDSEFVSYNCQSLLRLKEPAVLLRCREIDLRLVESVLGEAKEEYADKAKVHVPKVTIDDRVYLPPPPSSVDSHSAFW